MDRLEFECGYDLVDKIEISLDEIDDDYPLVSVYGHYDIIKTLLEDLITEGFSIENEIQLEDYEVSHYDKEFVLYVDPEGISVEKTYADDSYLYGSGDISFVHEDCSSALLKYVDSDKVYEFGYSDEDEQSECDDCDEKYCCDCNKPDDKPAATTFKENFEINGERVDRKTFEKELNKFEDRYLDNIKDMLLKYSSFMDDFNDLLRLFY